MNGVSRARAGEWGRGPAHKKPRNAARSRSESAGVIGGPSLFHTNAGGRSITHAPFTLAFPASRLSGVLASMRTTGPLTVLPFVPGAHAQLAATTSWTRGAVSRIQIGPRVHVPPKFHGSRCASRPYSLNLAMVQWLAARGAAEPVRRGPMISLRYCRLGITCERVRPWSMRTPALLVSTVGVWPASGRGASAASNTAAAAGRKRFTGIPHRERVCPYVTRERAAPLGGGGLSGRSGIQRALRRDGKADGHGRPPTRSRFHVDVAGEPVAYDALHHDQAHSAPLAELLCG